MGKGTDKLYITHSEWSSSDQYSASAGAGVRPSNAEHASFKRLPFNFCGLSLQPFTTPVCTSDGLIFDHENILRWLIKHDTNPTNGSKLKQSDLIRLEFMRNDGGDYVDPITMKVFTDNTYIVAIRHGDHANVFAHDTIDRLNFKPKMWKDLLSDEQFSRQDIITLQDPQNLSSRDLNSFKYLQEGKDNEIPKEEASINTAAMGNAAKILKAKEAVARARAERSKGILPQDTKLVTKIMKPIQQAAKIPYNATRHTTGLAAASFTSTGVTPHTSASLALMSDEEYLLKRGRVKQKGYARLETSLGNLNVELYPEFAPKAVWNFVRLAQNKYYNGIKFHRNIRNFMIQGGDPTGTGKGGTSIWGKNFEDEFDGPLKHDTKGTMSMANKGKDTNSSQFFFTYRTTKHLDRKHTIFGRITDGDAVLKQMEETPVDSSSRPENDIILEQVVVYVDPFEEFWKQKKEGDSLQKEIEIKRLVGADEDKTTWTGKRIRSDGGMEEVDHGVGRYLKSSNSRSVPVEKDEDEQSASEPIRKKTKGDGGFGNFAGW